MTGSRPVNEPFLDLLIELSGGGSRITLELRTENGSIRLLVSDNGSGFTAGSTPSGMGLHIMRYRAQSIGATLQIDSLPGEGTTISCCLPVRKGRMIGV